MCFKGLLENIDQWLCRYLSLHKESVWPTTLQSEQQKLFVGHTLSFKRHALKLPWQAFHLSQVTQVSTLKRQQLGSAMGKSMAKGLVISFDSPPIGKSTHET